MGMVHGGLPAVPHRAAAPDRSGGLSDAARSGQDLALSGLRVRGRTAAVTNGEDARHLQPDPKPIGRLPEAPQGSHADVDGRSTKQQQQRLGISAGADAQPQPKPVSEPGLARSQTTAPSIRPHEISRGRVAAAVLLRSHT